MVRYEVNLKTPIRYYGGKQNMIRDILPLIPEHVTYVEPFVGGGAVFWAKYPSDVEVINDINGDVVNFYRVLKTKPKMLARMIVGTPHSRLEYARAMKVLRSKDGNAVRRAWAFWVATQQGFSGCIGSWSLCVSSKNAQVKNRKDYFESNYKRYAERLSFVHFECKDALEVIKQYDTQDTFFYVDPPYVGACMGHYDGYSFDDFKNLIEVLKRVNGKFILSIGDVGASVVREMQVDWIELCLEKTLKADLNREQRPKRQEFLFLNFDPRVSLSVNLFSLAEEHLNGNQEQ